MNEVKRSHLAEDNGQQGADLRQVGWKRVCPYSLNGQSQLKVKDNVRKMLQEHHAHLSEEETLISLPQQSTALRCSAEEYVGWFRETEINITPSRVIFTMKTRAKNVTALA